MKMKKVLSALLTAAMVATLTACGDQESVTNNESVAAPAESVADDAATPDEESAPAEAETQTEAQDTAQKPTEPTGQLIIGSTTDLDEEFYDTSYDNNSFNYHMYGLLHGYSTVVYTKEGMFEIDKTVVKNYETTENEDGTKTYTVTINDGLVWSDGTPITAKDYVFEILLESSPEMMGVDAYPANGYTTVVGWDEFNAGETKNFKGIHLVDDMTYSITIKAEELPYHYDITYAGAMPRPLAVLAPDCDVEDSEDGATITGEFTTELLMKTINDPDTGYRYNPQVTCGAYLFKGYDTASRQGTLEVNPLYAGDYRGIKPMIKTLILKTVENATQMAELEAGTVDVLMDISGGESIEAGLDLVDEGKAQKSTHFRNGYGMITFDCSQFPTDSVNVRQAVALCLDRNEFARQYSGGYATIVHAAYGMAQWEYQNSRDWIDETLDTYEKDLDRAAQLLVDDGWTLNKDGGEYKEGDGVRYKDVDGELKSLTIEWCNTEGNPVSELLSTMLPESMETIGMELKSTTTDFPTLTTARSHQGEKIYNMYNTATGFATAHSPWYYYSSDPIWMTAGYNSNWIADEELESTTAKMKNLPYEAQDEWLEAWREFIKAWNEKLPDVPLYSDEYHDFFSNKLHDWDTTSTWTWDSAVLEAWVSE